MIWRKSRGIDLKFTQPSKHSQNAFIERYNNTYRHEALNAYLSEDLREVRKITENWISINNEEWPQGPLGRVKPKDYLA